MNFLKMSSIYAVKLPNYAKKSKPNRKEMERSEANRKCRKSSAERISIF